VIQFITVMVVGTVGTTPELTDVRGVGVLDFEVHVADRGPNTKTKIKVKVWDTHRSKLGTMLSSKLLEGMPVTIVGSLQEETWKHRVSGKMVSRLVVFGQKVAAPSPSTWRAMQESPDLIEEAFEEGDVDAFDKVDSRHQ
jgi:single-stranded DNA-binding protein